jgi:hypothetical protein
MVERQIKMLGDQPLHLQEVPVRVLRQSVELETRGFDHGAAPNLNRVGDGVLQVVTAVRYRQSWKDVIAATMSGATSAIRQRYRSRHPDTKAVDEPRSGFRRTTTERVAR